MADLEGGPWALARGVMVRDHLAARGVRDIRVLAACGRVPRERFVPPGLREAAYGDHPLPIGHGQTISQPYIVAFMAEALHLAGDERVLEIGSGSGYAIAILAELVPEVWGVELEPDLVRAARTTLADLGFADRIHLRAGDGAMGWPEAAPFGAILVSCAAEDLPRELLDQLGEGGRLLYPEGPLEGPQELVRFTRRGGRLIRDALLPVRFVPLRR